LWSVGVAGGCCAGRGLGRWGPSGFLRSLPSTQMAGKRPLKGVGLRFGAPLALWSFFFPISSSFSLALNFGSWWISWSFSFLLNLWICWLIPAVEKEV